MPGVTNPAEEFFKDGTWGWDGTQWHKLPMVWGYSDRWFEPKVTTNANAAQHDLDFTAVPPGYVYVLEAACGRDRTTGPSSILFSIYCAAGEVMLRADYAPVLDKWTTWEGRATLKQGDIVRVRFNGTAAGDDLYAQVWGHKMAVSE